MLKQGVEVREDKRGGQFVIVLNLDSLIAVAPFPLLCSETPDKRWPCVDLVALKQSELGSNDDKDVNLFCQRIALAK